MTPLKSHLQICSAKPVFKMCLYFRYINAIKGEKPAKDRRKVIAMTLDFRRPLNTWRIVRSAQLMRMLLPDWMLHLYTDIANVKTNDGFRGSSDFEELIRMPCNVYTTLNALNVSIKTIGRIASRYIPAIMWHYLVADEQEVDIFLVREAGLVLKDTDVAHARTLLHSNCSVVGISNTPTPNTNCLHHNRWGAWSEKLQLLLKGTSMKQALLTFFGNKSKLVRNENREEAFLKEILFHKVEEHLSCYDLN